MVKIILKIADKNPKQFIQIPIEESNEDQLFRKIQSRIPYLSLKRFILRIKYQGKQYTFSSFYTLVIKQIEKQGQNETKNTKKTLKIQIETKGLPFKDSIDSIKIVQQKVQSLQAKQLQKSSKVQMLGKHQSNSSFQQKHQSIKNEINVHPNNFMPLEDKKIQQHHSLSPSPLKQQNSPSKKGKLEPYFDISIQQVEAIIKLPPRNDNENEVKNPQQKTQDQTKAPLQKNKSLCSQKQSKLKFETNQTKQNQEKYQIELNYINQIKKGHTKQAFQSLNKNDKTIQKQPQKKQLTQQQKKTNTDLSIQQFEKVNKNQFRCYRCFQNNQQDQSCSQCKGTKYLGQNNSYSKYLSSIQKQYQAKIKQYENILKQIFQNQDSK